MSEVRSDIDLSRLSRERSPKAIERPKRSRLRWAIPAAILLGFAGMLVWALGDALRARVSIRVVRPMSVAAEGGESPARGSEELVFAAAGWVEPDPFPIHVPALTSGVLASVLVQEGDSVEAGQAIAKLVPDDAQLELQSARRALAVAEADHAGSEVEVEYAQRDFDARLALDEALQKSEAELRGKIGERDALVEAAKRTLADVVVAREELEVQRELRAKGAGGPRQVELAAARVESARAAQSSAQASAAHASAQVDVARAVRARVLRDAELRIEERRRVAAAKAARSKTRARIEAAKTRVAIAELAHTRLVVRAPSAGTVLERSMAPGESVASGSIVQLYDPESLRIRVDVPQEKFALARVGQSARILSEARPGRPYRGIVQRTIHRADIQKVTLEVRVRVLDPDELLRPEMLCQVQVLGGDEVASSAARKKASPAANAPALLIPAELVVDGSVWVLDPDGPRMRKRRVELGGERRLDGKAWALVRAGLDPSDKLVVAAPSERADGALVKIEEDK